jgi:hypothetical protein
MSAAKHVLLRIWSRGGPTKTTAVWELDRWHTHRPELMRNHNLSMDEANAKYVIAVGGLKRLRLLQASLSRLDNA